jgi:hypothetical protein
MTPRATIKMTAKLIIAIIFLLFFKLAFECFAMKSLLNKAKKISYSLYIITYPINEGQ